MENQNNNQPPQQRKSGVFRKALIILIVVVALIVTFAVIISQPKGKEVGFQFFGSELSAGNIERVDFENSRISFKTKNGEWYWFYNRDTAESDVRLQIETYNELVRSEEIEGTVVQMNFGTTTTFNFLSLLFPILLVIVMGFTIYLIFRQIRGINSRGMEFTKNRARVAASKVKFDRVAGADEEKAELEEIIQFLKDPEKFIKIGARIPKGVLLVGPPGTGKTLLAKAVAGEANVPFFTISGSDFMELYVGVGASRVRDLFENAKLAKPCIVFIDEIDAVGRQRGTGLGGGNDEREQTLNQLLVQMDGFDTNEGIIVMAATNRADILDPALTRPGRFDRQIYINVPDVKGREEILRVHAQGKPLSSEVKLKEVARVTSGFTGADLENLLNEAAILAARRNRKTIGSEDINNAIVKVTMGPQKRSRVVAERDKKITAFHESGHAIVEKCVKTSNPVHEVSIIQRGGAAGYTISRPDNDESHITKQKLIDTIAMMLGGRAAEETFLDDITTGASSDLSRATELARRMVTEWGMSDELGLVHHGESNEVFLGRDYQTRATYSEVEASKIDAEIKKIIDKCYKEAKTILAGHKGEMQTMVDVLLEKETIYSDEVDMIMNGSTKEDVVKFIEDKAKSRKEADDKEKAAEKLNEKTGAEYVNELLKRAENKSGGNGTVSRETSGANTENKGNSNAQSEQKTPPQKEVTEEVAKKAKKPENSEAKEKQTKAESGENKAKKESSSTKKTAEKKTTTKAKNENSKNEGSKK